MKSKNKIHSNAIQKDTPYNNFQRLIRGIVAVPKKEIEAEEAKWREARRLKKKSAPS
jgi:hypothetical protein